MGLAFFLYLSPVSRPSSLVHPHRLSCMVQVRLPAISQAGGIQVSGIRNCGMNQFEIRF